jgi:hypothetical protein
MRQVEEINKMSYDELEDEVLNCDMNPVKEMIIRKLMKHKLEISNRSKPVPIRPTSRSKSRSKSKNKSTPKPISRSQVEDTTEYNLDDLLDEIQSLDSNLNIDSDSEYIENIKDENIDDLLSSVMFDSDIVHNRQPVNQNNNQRKEDYREKLLDNKFKGEIERDVVNNHLMDRLGSDIYIKNLKDNRNRDKTIVSPFSDTHDGKYAPYQTNNRR